MDQNNSMDMEKKRTSKWFKELRDKILDNFEYLESNQKFGKFLNNKPGKFVIPPPTRRGRRASQRRVSWRRGGP